MLERILVTKGGAGLEACRLQPDADGWATTTTLMFLISPCTFLELRETFLEAHEMFPDDYSWGNDACDLRDPYD
jgi:hypothetical protein